MWERYALLKDDYEPLHFRIYTVILLESAAGMTKYSEAHESLKRLYIDDERPWLVGLN